MVSNGSPRSDIIEDNITTEPSAVGRIMSLVGLGYSRRASGERGLPSDGGDQDNATVDRSSKRRPIPLIRAVRRSRQNSRAMEANTAALGFLKCAILFFMSLLITVCTIQESGHFRVDGKKGRWGTTTTSTTTSIAVLLEECLLTVAFTNTKWVSTSTISFSSLSSQPNTHARSFRLPPTDYGP